MQLMVHRPLLARLSQAALYRHIRHQLAVTTHQRAVSVLREYSKRLGEWRVRMLDDMRQTFARRADMLCARLRPEVALVADTPDDLSNDLVLLAK